MLAPLLLLERLTRDEDRGPPEYLGESGAIERDEPLWPVHG